ncbi:hypothetical protein [Paenibacillus mendelii]|uniref:Uncharacterized protein n=1 Tax=Paenibacillus mendelii TaxID=206163 RepID=A0ABV6JA12_9BACL|nr:hypothetical protein [Paenibacillus mendelii]
MQTMTKKRIAAIITEYWDISHADVIITKMLEGFTMDGRQYTSTIDIVSMYVDKFPENDISRDLAAKHNIPLYGTIEDALKCGGKAFDLDGIIIIGEHGDYPTNEIGQILYPRRAFFEACLTVMVENNHIVPIYSDKGFAVTGEDVKWVYKQIKQHHIPFFSSSVVPFAHQYPASQPHPNGAPLHKMFGFAYGDVERYTYHTLEMMQSLAENRACGESGITAVRAYEGEAAREKLLGAEWGQLYRSLGSFINLIDIEKMPYSLTHPLFFEVDYVDGLRTGMLYAEQEVRDFACASQMYEDSEPFCTEFYLQPGKPYIHFGILVLEIEKFFHTSRPPFPVERSYLTSGALDALMKAIHHKEEVVTPHLRVKY